MYDRYRADKRASLPPDLDARLLRELKEGIAAARVGERDHVVFHTAYADVYRALPGYVAGTDWSRGPCLHVCTPYDLETMPGKTPGSPLADVFSGLRTIEAVDRKLFFWAETPQLAAHFTARYGFNVRALPLPPPRPESDYAAAAEAGPVTALYLGAAREEKGFLHLPDIAARLYESHGRTGKLRFVIQCTPQIVGYVPSIKAAIEALSRFPAAYVRLIEAPLGEDEYHAELAACDAVLLLYNQKNYRIRGSGIAVEAVCAGKCLLARRDTFCASLITHGGGRAVDGVDDTVHALAELAKRPGEYRERASTQAAHYRRASGAQAYVRRIIGQADESRRVPFFPSSIAGHVSPVLFGSAWTG
mgnify:CR=1 FL=1